MQRKFCSRCGLELDISMFYKDKKHNGEYQSQCKNCQNKLYETNIEVIKKWHEVNKEAIAKQRKEYQKANKEAKAIYIKQYHEANREALKEHYKEYRKNNRETLKKQMRKWYEANKEIASEKGKEYRKVNKEIVTERKKWCPKYDNNSKKREKSILQYLYN